MPGHLLASSLVEFWVGVSLPRKVDTQLVQIKYVRVRITSMWKIIDSDWNLSRHLIPFLQDVPFYAEISRHLQKRFTYDIPTLAVSFDPRCDELVLWVNPKFMSGGSYTNERGEEIKCEALTNWEIRGCLTHEFDHLVFGHLNVRRRMPADKWNIATDLAINSLIYKNAGQPRDVDPGVVARPLPKIALVPGKRPYVEPDQLEVMTPERKLALEKFSDLIENLPPLKSSEWYFNKLMEDSKQDKKGKGDIEEFILGSLDNHDGWDEVTDDMQEYVQGRIKSIIEKAVKHADSQSDGWGNIPEEIRNDIRKSVSQIINWRTVLRQFVGMLVRGNRTTTIKRINKRYPYIHPGTKRGYTAKLLIAIDESGSVGDEMLQMFFAELETLTKKVDITLLHFDCSCSMQDIYEWKKGTRPSLKRMRSGGTNFSAPTNLVNDPKNRGRWDGMLIMTDGQAPAPGPSRVRRGWVLGQGCNLEFPTSEIQISLSKERPMSGAWR